MFKQIICVLTNTLLLISCTNKTKTQENKTIHSIAEQFNVSIHDDAARSLIDSNASFEILATGFKWSEGPLWVPDLQALIFSDVPTNKIYKWSEQDSLSIYLEYAGHTGERNKESERGSNGLFLCKENKNGTSNLLLFSNAKIFNERRDRCTIHRKTCVRQLARGSACQEV